MDRIQAFQKALSSENIDVAVLLNNGEYIDSNFFYFTGLRTEYEMLLIPKKGKPILLASSLEYERARKASKVKDVIRMRTRKEFDIQLKKYLGGKVAGINQDFLPLNLINKLKRIGKPKKLKDISCILIAQRAEKSDEEIVLMRKACDISKVIFERTISDFSSFRTEIAVADFMEGEMKKHCCTPAFPTIIASGKNASMPHHEPSASKLNKGFCIIDFGVNHKGYCSDITRTVYIGLPSKKEIEQYYELLGVQEEAIKKLKAGVDYSNIHKSAQKVLGEKFIHGLGHGLGIDVHEPLTPKIGKKLILKEGNCLTVEPGVYEAGKYGIRIEDDILITKKGAVVLSKNIKKELIVIE